MRNYNADINPLSKLNILEQYNFFRSADDELRHKIIEAANISHVEAETHLFRNGSNAEYIAFIGQGNLRVYVVGECGREVTLYRVNPGESCPINILSALLNISTPAIAVVESRVESVVIRADTIRSWVSEYPDIWQFILQATAGRLVDVLSLMQEMKFRKLAHRLAEFLIGRFAHSELRPPMIQLTHERIASELGSTREVITRQLREFERMNIIKLARGRVYLNCETALRNVFQIEPEKTLIPTR